MQLTTSRTAVISRMILLLTSSATTLFTVGCGSMKVDKFAGNTPQIKFEEFFHGKVRGWGQIYRGSKVTQEFVVDINGHWQGETLVMDEDFLFNDGKRVKRAWHVRKNSEGRYQAEAEDVEGIGQGESSGNAIHWNYQLSLEKFAGSSLIVNCEDWMFRKTDGLILNRVQMKKWGFTVSEMAIVMQKLN